MTARVFFAATGQHCGKTTTSVLMMHIAKERFGKVGFIKPVGQEYREVDGLKVDKDALLMADIFGLRKWLPYMSPVVSDRGFTRRYLDGEIARADLVQRIEDCFLRLAEDFDAVVIEGTGHTGVGSVFGMNNAQAAALLQAPVILVTGGGIGNVVDRVHMALPLYENEGASVKAVIPNKLMPDKRARSLEYLTKALEPLGIGVEPGLNYSPKLANPSLQNLAKKLKVELQGDPEAGHRLVDTIQMGVASSQRVVDLLKPDTLLITASTRDELLVTLSSLYKVPEYKSRLAGLVVTGPLPMSPITETILHTSRVPFFRTQVNSTIVLTQLMEHVAKLSGEDTSKLTWLKEHGQKSLNESAWADLFARDAL